MEATASALTERRVEQQDGADGGRAVGGGGEAGGHQRHDAAVRPSAEGERRRRADGVGEAGERLGRHLVDGAEAKGGGVAREEGVVNRVDGEGGVQAAQGGR